MEEKVEDSSTGDRDKGSVADLEFGSNSVDSMGSDCSNCVSTPRRQLMHLSMGKNCENSSRGRGDGNAFKNESELPSLLTAAGRGLSNNQTGGNRGNSKCYGNETVNSNGSVHAGASSNSNGKAESTDNGSKDSGDGTLSVHPKPKLQGILKKDGLTGGNLGRSGMGRRSSSFYAPKGLSRSSNSLSTRFHLVPPTKTVRFRLESDNEKRPWFALLEIMDPGSLFMVRWKSLCIVFLSISFFRLPVIMAFGAHGLLIDFICDVYFFIDNIFALHTAYLKKGELKIDRRRIARRYFSWKTFMRGERWSYLVFLMEFVPFYSAIIIMAFYTLPDWFLTLCAASRARRMYDLLSYFHALELRLDSDLRVLAVTKYGLVLFGSAHWFGCVWWAVARFSGFTESCWVSQFLRLTARPVSEESFRSTSFNYFLSLYWGFTVLTGTMVPGYAPDSSQETILSIVSIFSQVLIFSFLFGILLHYIVKKDANQEKYKSLIDKVERYAKMHELPRRLESSIKLCFTFQHQNRIGQDEEILSAIPMTMKTKILAYRYQMVAANEIFEGCQEHFVTSVLAVLRPKILIPGVTIFNRDDMTREAVFLEEGEVEVHAEDDAGAFRMIKPSEDVFPVVGAIAFFLGIPQPYTHKASMKSHVKLLTLSKDDYEDIRDRYPESRDQLIGNITAAVGLTRDGDMDDISKAVVLEMESPMGMPTDVDGDSNAARLQEQRQRRQQQQQDLSQSQAATAADLGVRTGETEKVALRRKVALGLRKKMDDELATMFNAVEEGDLESVKLLLDKGFKVNTTDYDLRSSLHFAATRGEDKIVELLTQRGADVHSRDRWGRNALQDAIDNGCTVVASMLAAQGAELRLRNSAGRLCAAAFTDNLFELQRLIENGVDCNVVDYDGRTALHLGACEGNNKVVEYLLLPINKCNPGVLDRWGISPLFDAIKHGNLSVARVLYENGARLSKGKAATFLCTAAANGDSSLLQMLFECGVETNIGDYDYRYPIHLAAAEGEVISVEFLAYAHAELSVKDRWGRTPLDDAITEGHLCCAKMLMSFGAEYTISIDAATQARIDAVDLKEVRAMVRAERTVQNQHKSVAKQLREMVKWMAAETETWQKSVEERLKHLKRTTDRMISGDEIDDFHLDTQDFLAQSDLSILVSERPERVTLESNMSYPDSYMLSRFISEASSSSDSAREFTSTSYAANGAISSEATSSDRKQNHGLKSMQHFFLKWSLIHSAIKNWKENLIVTARRDMHEPPGINQTALGIALRSLGVSVTDHDLDRAFEACKSGTEEVDTAQRVSGLGEVEEMTFLEGNAMISADKAATAPESVSCEDVVMAMPVWSLIMHAPAAGGSDLSRLQEAVHVICEGYRLLTRHGNGKLGRAAWMIQKRETDLGEFSSVIDQVFLDQDVIDKESFFLTVARWAALRDEDNGVSDDYGSGAYEKSTVLGLSPDDDASFQSEGGDLDKMPSGVANSGTLRESRMPCDLGHSLSNSSWPELAANRLYLERIESDSSLQGQMSFLSANQIPHLYVKKRNLWTRLCTAWKLFCIKRKLRASLKAGEGQSRTQLAMPDFARHFARLDLERCDWLDRNRTELLLARGFDADLSRGEWGLLAESLKDNVVGKVSLAAVERFWMELNGVSAKLQVASALDASRRGINSLNPSQRVLKDNAAFDAEGSKRIPGAMILVERRSWSEALLFDRKGWFISMWVVVMIVNALYYFLSVPFIIAFLRDEILGEYESCLWVAYAFDCLLLCDVLVKLNTSFIDTSCSVLVVNRRRIRHRYLTGGFLRDLVGMLPVDILVRFLGGSGTLVAFLRLPKLIFCYRLVNFFRRRSLNSSSRLAVDLQALLFSALGMIHILTCVWFFMTEGDPGNYQALSGYEDYGNYTNDPSGGGPFRLEYYIFCYMLITTIISTQGIYDVVMGQAREIWFTMFILLLNLSAWAYLMGTISGLCVTADESIAQSHELMTAVSRFIQHNPMPPGVSEELKGYFNINAQQKTQLSLTEQTQIYHSLPLSLQVEAARHISRDSLLCVEIFTKTSEYFLDSVSTLLDMELFGVGDYVYKADDICRSLYIVASGSVEVGKMNSETNEFEVDEIAGVGYALGQLEFLFDVRYMTSARVSGADDVRVFRLGKEDFTRVIKLYPMDEDILYENLSRLADDKMETSSRAPSTAQSMSTHSLDFTVVGGDDLMEKAMDSIDKAKKRSKEQRIRSFCNAAAEGNMDILQRLLRSGIDINGRDCNERTALMLATSAGNFELVKWLVSLGAEVNLRDKFGGSALLDAMRHSTPLHMEIMGFLSKQGAVLELDDAAGELCQAAADGEREKLARMLELNTSPDVADYDKRTPLHLAASEGRLDCVKLLLEYWADVNPIDRMGGTPLSDAVRHGHLHIQTLLRQHGGKLNMDPFELGTCACEAGSSGDLDSIRVLVENGADINTGDYDGRTALHMATCYNRLSVIEYLVSLPSINLNPLDRLVNTPLDDAEREGQGAIVKILQARGGVPGTHPSLKDQVAQQKQKKAEAEAAKKMRREAAARLFEEWSLVQEDLSRVYSFMSEYLPSLCKNINILSMTLRSRRTQSTIDRSPRPDLAETRLYFYKSFLAFLERRYKVNLEMSLTLIEELEEITSFEDKARIAGYIVERFLDAKSSDRVHFHPTQVGLVKERLLAAFPGKVFPVDLLEPFRASVVEKMEELLPDYFKSDFYYRACRQPNGFLWRVMKLSRLLHGLCNQILVDVINPFLKLCNRDALACVPHYSKSNRQAFREEFVKLKINITSLQPVLHIVGYKSKHDAMQECIKERREKRTGTGGTGHRK